jgi:hypothetical protein
MSVTQEICVIYNVFGKQCINMYLFSKLCLKWKEAIWPQGEILVYLVK